MSFLHDCLSNSLFYLDYFAGIQEAYVIIMKEMYDNQVADKDIYCQLFALVFNKGKTIMYSCDNNVQEAAAQHSLPVSALSQAIQCGSNALH